MNKHPLESIMADEEALPALSGVVCRGVVCRTKLYSSKVFFFDIQLEESEEQTVRSFILKSKAGYEDSTLNPVSILAISSTFRDGDTVEVSYDATSSADDEITEQARSIRVISKGAHSADHADHAEHAADAADASTKETILTSCTVEEQLGYPVFKIMVNGSEVGNVSNHSPVGSTTHNQQPKVAHASATPSHPSRETHAAATTLTRLERAPKQGWCKFWLNSKRCPLEHCDQPHPEGEDP